MQRLLHSSKFWLAVLDVVFSTILYFTGKYAGAAVDDVKFIIVSYQPVIALVIGSIAVEDAAAKRAGLQPARKV